MNESRPAIRGRILNTSMQTCFGVWEKSLNNVVPVKKKQVGIGVGGIQ